MSFSSTQSTRFLHYRGQRFICGVSPREEDDPDCSGVQDLDLIQHNLFEEVIWPTLAERVPAFESIKVCTIFRF
jgi:hypothetical protein